MSTHYLHVAFVILCFGLLVLAHNYDEDHYGEIRSLPFSNVGSHKGFEMEFDMHIFDWIAVGGSIFWTILVGTGFGLDDLYFDRTILRRKDSVTEVVDRDIEAPLLTKPIISSRRQHKQGQTTTTTSAGPETSTATN